jgi:AcrR family transcriptional regulator
MVVQPQNASASRREVILDAALESFLRNGVAGTTIDDIRFGADCSTGSIYHFFGSKEGVAGALYVSALREYLEAFADALDGSRSAREGVEGAVRAHLSWVSRREERARYLFLCREPELMEALRPAVAEVYEGFYAHAQRWLRPHVDSGRIRALAPELCQALWIGPCAEYSRLWLTDRRRRSALLDAQETLATAAWSVLAGPKR